ncbi:MAG: hypothetical protein COW00_19105 [Bdellovibrio sp. CG12_big_fil_rev_8_21_14_0_65_39_13]|nr:MAG: hypothetical protein COW78_17170 [Bdellovibrio sp. CG22_combo_CG10-13_8_21_14_all_39_27]PIQ57806.1 MAG: hypothetical protein COW00_19105 [Bdellovibrio sp. CG12_big_fil_rev_8_21_14_0_65_39_13]PIR34680.1 MAG: hypothetical protein COV37_12155 [Bdellovibrio sp. CG11_big_fil_rev_8_21_14_0_20_39_38]PJB53772.1 MAG: hypothetical protein CO099_05320 [Bdellovibrio sp. CG_4_9_14_3_um_filter_39_7]
MKIILVVFLAVLSLSSCSFLSKFNSVEGKLLNEENYATINDKDYASGESQSYGISVTNKQKAVSNDLFSLDFSLYPDASFEISRLLPNDRTLQTLKVRRVSGFASGKGVLHTPIGAFEISAGVGLSYLDAFNDTIDTSKVEPTFRYEGTYTAFLIQNFYGAVSFTFQESPHSTYSEYYALVYKIGYVFGKF